MSLAVAGRKRQTVQTARHLAECSRKWRLRQETSDGRPLTVKCIVPIRRDGKPSPLATDGNVICQMQVKR